MNKKLLWALIGIVAVGGGVFAYMKYFGASEKHLSIVPIDAAIVVGFDLKSLADKSDYKGKFKSTKLYQYFEKQSKQSSGDDVQDKILGSVLKDPIGSGLSLGSKVYVFITSNSNAKYICTVAALNDENNFADMMAKSGVKSKLEKSKSMSYYKVGDKELLCWSNKGLLYISTVNHEGMGFEAPVDLVAEAEKMMGQEDSKSILGSVYFKQAVKKQKDISMFFNYGSYFKIAGSVAQTAQLEGFSQSFNGVFALANLEFEKDKIALTSEMIGEKEAIEKLQMTKSDGIGSHALQCISDGDVLSMFSLNLETNKVINLLDDMLKPTVELKTSLNSLAEMSGVKYEDLVAALSGEMTFSLSGFESISVIQPSFEINEATGQYEMIQKSKTVTMPKFNMALGIKNKAIIDRLLEQTKVPVENDMRIIAIPLVSGMNIYLVSKDQVLFLSNVESFGRTVQSKGKLGDLSNKKVKDLAKDHSSAFYMNLDMNKYESLFSGAGQQVDKSVNQMKAYMSIFTDVQGTGNSKSSEYIVNLKSGEGNSLYRLLKQADVLDIE